MLRPFQSSFQVHSAANPELDSWKGARQWGMSGSFNTKAVTRAEYEEHGSGYLKEDSVTNRYFPSPGGGVQGEETLIKSESQASLV